MYAHKVVFSSVRSFLL